MVILEDTDYADLSAMAQRTASLDTENGHLRASAADLEAEVADLKAQIERLTEQTSETPEEQERRFELLRLQAENERLKEKLGIAIRRRFGPSSERRITGQEALLFNEVEAEAAPGAPEPLRQVKAHVRSKRKGGQKQLDMGGIEIREVEYELASEQQVCPICSGPVRRMGEEERIKVEIAPIVVTIKREKQAKYCCCSPDNHPMSTPIIKAPLPPTAFPKSMASASVVAYIMHEKYVMGSPLYRQEQQLARDGFPISRQTMANWVIAGAAWLDLMYLRLHKLLIKEEALHADESPIQVLHEPGVAPTTKSYMWLYRTGRYSPPIVLYDYQPTRGREHPQRFLQGYKGYLHVDGLSSYEMIPGIVLAGCWAHARRKYIEALDTLPAAKREAGGTKSHEGLAFCTDIFKIESDLHDASPQERHAARQVRSRMVLDEYRRWLDTTAIDVVPKTPLGAAIGYSVKQWSKLTVFLEDGRLEVDNNRAERSIKPFVTGRKNWLFANTPTGADASATIYSIIETAKENNLNPRTYLKFLFEQLPLINLNNHAEIDALLPWKRAPQRACGAAVGKPVR